MPLNISSSDPRDLVLEEGCVTKFVIRRKIQYFICRPACADKSEIFNLKCSDGGVPTLGVGTFPKCAAGNAIETKIDPNF